MDMNAELLNYIYQNSEMGVNTTNQLIGIVKNEKLENHLRTQAGQYKEINSTAKKALADNGYDEKGISGFDKVKTYLTVNMETMKDKSASHISEMMILGSTMGIVDSLRNMKKYDGAKREHLDLMQKLCQYEENNIQALKGFL